MNAFRLTVVVSSINPCLQNNQLDALGFQICCMSRFFLISFTSMEARLDRIEAEIAKLEDDEIRLKRKQKRDLLVLMKEPS